MGSKLKSQIEIYRLLSQYISCLTIYFEALHEACLQVKQRPNPLRLPRDTSSIEVLERFIAVGKQLQKLLQEQV